MDMETLVKQARLRQWQSAMLLEKLTRLKAVLREAEAVWLGERR